MRYLVLASALLLAACANPWNIADVAPGTPSDLVIARAGQPARVLPLAGGGQRLQYTLQPLGQYAFMVDLDPAGRVLQSRQVLREAEFNRIAIDQWTRADIEREFGPPARIDAVSSWAGPVYTYRWRNDGDMLYYVYFDAQGVVRRAHPGIEHVNAPNDRR
jgi:hypothetical protein